VRRQAIVVGAGSYVLGDSWGHGVVLPTLLDERRSGGLDSIHLVVRTPRDAAFHARLAALGAELGLDPSIHEHVLASEAGLEELPLEDSVAFVCVPDSRHATYARAFVERGVPTWLVKPMTGRGDESRALDDLARERDVPLWVDYHKRFDASNKKLAALVDGGSLGRMLLYSVQYTQPWRLPLRELSTWSREVDVFQYIGCHYVDLLFFLFPEAVPRRVSATGLPGRLAAEGGPAHDVVHAVIDFAVAGRALRADFQVGWNDPGGTPAKSHQRVECIFTHGRIVADQKERGFELWSEDRFDQVNPHFLQVLPDPLRGGTRVEGYGPDSIRGFLAAHDSPAARASTALPWSAQAWRVDLVLDQVRASLADDGAWIECAWR